MKPRVLQLIGSFHNGGSERQAISLSRLLKDEGSFDVSIAVLNDDGILRDEASEIAGDVPAFPIKSFFRPSFLRQMNAFASYLREQKIDLIHTTDFYTNVFGMAAAAKAGTYARVASKRETGGMRSRGQDRVERLAFTTASKIVVNSKAVLDHLDARGIKQGRLELIYNGVDVASFNDAGSRTNEVRKTLDLPSDTSLVTLVANLRHSVKNVPMLLRAAEIVLRSVMDVTFVIAGEGELKSDLEAMASELGIEEMVYFTGRCDDVPSLLAASEICVLTSSAEGFSNSILEYMAAGRPVVATKVGGAAEVIVDGETGYLVESNDDAAMAARLIDLLNDPAKAAAFGAAGRKRVKADFSTEQQLNKTLALYQQLLAD